jgi:hypothetical protein
MSVFRNIRIFPSHGSKSALLTWSLLPGTPAGQVYVAYSTTGVPDSWEVLNQDAPVASAVGMFEDTRLQESNSSTIGYYRFLLVNVDGDTMSEPVGILGDISPREYGMVRAIMHREFQEMKATQGYPVWHCVPRDQGQLSARVDPLTGEVVGTECSDAVDPSYGLPYIGGFYPPMLTWMRPLAISRGTIRDRENELSPTSTDTTSARLLAFPTPFRHHMLVDPATDRRYLVGDEIKPFLLRGVMPVAYEVTLEALDRADPRYRFPVPAIDTKNYRKIPYWSQA